MTTPQILSAAMLIFQASLGTASGEPVEPCEHENASPAKPWTTNVPPSYPSMGPDARETVTLRFVVDHEGSVREPAVLDGREPFASAALNAVKEWKYEPARQAGRPIAVAREIQVHFQSTPKTSDRWHLYRREKRVASLDTTMGE